MEITKEYLTRKELIEVQAKSLVEQGTIIRRKLDDYLGEYIDDMEVKEVRSSLGRLTLAVEEWDMENDKSQEAEELEELINKVKNWLKTEAMAA